jgi:branched-chain amino acid transport system permease protein
MDWANAIVQGVLLGGVYALYAIGLSLVFGVMRIVNLAHGDLSICAAYLALVIVNASHVNPFWTVALVVPAMFLFGYVLQRYLLNFTLSSGDEMRPLLATFGISIILQNVLLWKFSADSQGLDAGHIETASISVGSKLAVGWLPLLMMAVGILTIFALQQFLTRTQLGRAFRATSDDQGAAQLMGINNKNIYALAMAIALAVVGLAGIFMGIRTTFAPAAGSARLIFAFEAVIMGGLGSTWGTLIGGIMLGVAQNIGAQISPGWGVLAGNLLFIAVLVFKPSGLLAKTVQS